jgi:hypothetical protein
MKDYAIKLGSMLFTMVQPRPGFEVDYNRWYERDHFYAGCMIGAYTFAGQRWVATRSLKALRYPDAPSDITADPQLGSYLGLYWVLAGHHDEWNRWSVDQVQWLHANGRMFTERDHIHTALYNYEWAVVRDADGPSPELALDHRYAGLAAVVVDGDDRTTLEAWYRDAYLPGAIAGGPVGQVLAFTPRPLLADAPGDVPRGATSDARLLLLWFLDAEPAGVWSSLFAEHPAQVSKAGVGEVVWASPFIPTIPGTDIYTDQL